MSLIHNKYVEKCNTPSDINEHLPVLKEFALKCKHVTEMGVRFVTSTWAFLDARPEKVVSIDIQYYGEIDEAARIAREENVDFIFVLGDTSKIEIEPTDFLFIDTLHSYEQLKKELYLHGNKVAKYIGFHDTITFGQQDEQCAGTNGPGLRPAIEEFLADNPQWQVHRDLPNNNGLLILKHVSVTE
jgi:cephalosporin hydroxylase